MSWGTVAAVVLGGVITIAAYGVQAWWTAHTEVRRRSDQAAEAARAHALRMLTLGRRFPQSDPLDVPDELERCMEEEVLPELRRETGYLADRKIRDEMTFLAAESLDRWLDVAQYGGDLPGRVNIPPNRGGMRYEE